MSDPARHPYFGLDSPTILGHRGAAGDVPENTIASFQTGLAQGAHILESDIQMTRDGVAVLLHDAAVERTTNGSGSVADLTLSQLQELDAGYRFCYRDPLGEDPGSDQATPFRGRDLRVPTLKEAFAAFPQASFNLEIKSAAPGLVRRVVELVREYQREDRTLLAAGSDAVMAELRAELEGSPHSPALGASPGDVLAFVQAAIEDRAPNPKAMALQIPTEFGGQPLVTRELVEHARRHGIVIHVWTVDDPKEICRLLDLGVDGLVTNYPARMTQVIEEWRDRG